jgi:hypothetical protein
MSAMAADDALRMLAKWSGEGAVIRVVLSQGQRAASVAILNRVLPESQKALLTLRDEGGEDVAVTISLQGATWECGDTGAALTARFPNGHRYVFGERVEAAAE